MDATRTFIPLHALSRQLGLPAAWIKVEAEAGRIPHLRAGRRLMFNSDAVERILIDRARQQAGKSEPVTPGSEVSRDCACSHR